jgi:hypothetical protein
MAPVLWTRPGFRATMAATMKATSLVLAGAALVVAGTACKRRPPPPAPPTVAAPKPAAVDSGVAAKAKRPPAVERAQVEREIRDVIARWVAAQNQGDFAAYTALYDQGHFRGQKRTQTGKTTRADWAIWRDDRGKMFDKGSMTVAVEELAIRTWLDQGASLRPGVSEARFVQRWRNPRYADHGVKVLQLLRTSTGMAILYEDMLTSSPGWQDAAAIDAGGVFALGDDLPLPKSDHEAMALWRKLELTQATVLDATHAMGDFAGADLMAEALLRHGSFTCKRYVDYDECGESRIEWQEIPPDTGFGDPCVQRTAGVWAIAAVKARRLPALADALVKLASIPAPEEQIPDALVERLADMPEPLRLQVVRAMLAVRCDKEGCGEWQPGLPVAELAAKSRIALYHDDKLAVAARQAAIDGVDLARSPQVLVEVYGDEGLDVAFRQRLWSTLSAQKPAVVERALRLAADDRSCGFAMAAIEALAARGKKDLLPRAGKDDSARVLCLLLNASDRGWARREFRKLLPKRGKILFTEESQDEMDGEGGEKKTSEESIPVRNVGLDTLPEALREHVGPVHTYVTGHAETVDVEFDDEGLLEGVSKTSWSGCPC